MLIKRAKIATKSEIIGNFRKIKTQIIHRKDKRSRQKSEIVGNFRKIENELPRKGNSRDKNPRLLEIFEIKAKSIAIK